MADVKQASSLALEGSLGIEHASSLAERLRSALALGRAMSIDLSGVDDFDLPGIQLLYALARSAMQAGLGIEFTGSIRPQSIQRLIAAGFISQPAADAGGLIAQLPDFPGAASTGRGRS